MSQNPRNYKIVFLERLRLICYLVKVYDSMVAPDRVEVSQVSSILTTDGVVPSFGIRDRFHRSQGGYAIEMLIASSLRFIDRNRVE